MDAGGAMGPERAGIGRAAGIGRVAIVGRGRLGRSAAELLARAGVEVWIGDHAATPPLADACWICVPDGQIAATGRAVRARIAAARPGEPLPPGLHASGAAGPGLLDWPERGVLHPLMTFPGPEYGLPDLRGARAAISGTPGAVAAAAAIAARLGLAAVRLEIPEGEEGGQAAREEAVYARYHAAAVLASSHMAAVFLAGAEELARLGVPEAEARAALYPLARESLERAAAHGAAALTGPTVRGDRGTEARHLAALSRGDRGAAARYRQIRALIRRLIGGGDRK